MIATMTLNKKKSAQIAASSFSTATDIAEYLSKKGMPFRTSHHVVGDIVKFCEKNDKQLVDLSIDELQAFSKLIDKDIFKILDPTTCIQSRTGKGETSSASVLRESKATLKRLKKYGFK
jgi:argininosuccinate lyase